MKRFDASEFLWFATSLEALERITEGESDPLRESFKEKLPAWCNTWGPSCKELGFVASAKTIEKVRALLFKDAIYKDFTALAKELKGRVIDEADAIVFLALDANLSRYFTDSDLFGARVAMAFPSTDYDIEEAGKCLALHRGTACVFHLMRILEIGLRVLSASLGDPRLDPTKNPTWSKFLSRCTSELAKPKAQRVPEWRTDDEFYSGATARLLAVKDAWRNPTMHVRSKYTEEEALDIWNHVKAFMAHLATKLKE